MDLSFNLLLLSGLLASLAVVLVGLVFWFGRELYIRQYGYEYWHWLWDHLHVQWSGDLNVIRELVSDALEKRNKFWGLYIQFALSVLVVLVIAILLLTKTIEPDAGLPILGTLIGFAIGKGIESRGNGFTPPLPKPEERPSGKSED